MQIPVSPAALAERQRVLAATLLGLDQPPADDLDILRLVRGRLSPQTVGALQAAGLDARTLGRIIPRRTLEHRRQKGEALSLEESERAYRAAQHRRPGAGGVRQPGQGAVLAPCPPQPFRR